MTPLARWLASAALPQRPARAAEALELQWRGHTLGATMAALVAAHGSANALLLASWTFLGLAAFSGRPEPGWLSAWALALVCTVPLRTLARWLEGQLLVGFGQVLRRRLLCGALAVGSDTIRGRGAADLLSDALETDAIDAAVAGNGLQPPLALLDLAMVLVVFVSTAAVGWQSLLLLAAITVALLLARRNMRLRLRWTAARLRLSSSQIEQMAGHRTRLVQQPPAQWHREDDALLARYADASRRLDRSTAALQTALPRLYLAAAVAALLPAFAAGEAAPTALALALGGSLFAAAALERALSGLPRFASAWIAWRRVAAMAAAARLPDDGAAPSAGGEAVLTLRHLRYTHPGKAQPVLDGGAAELRPGQRALLAGGSGAGKSTLVSLLEGARRPAAGAVLLGGLDRHLCGDTGWRRRIAVAPQYQDNHVLAASLAFNLLLARRYPHADGDLDDVRALCEALGLASLVERMPAGLEQLVGEQGWRLSHGERSRMFLARALLQGAPCVVLDESLAALDPQTLRRCVTAAVQRAPMLVIVSHDG